VYREAAFVVLEGPWRRRGGYVTVVTTAHASVLTELPSWQMAAVLAGLTKAADRLREASGASSVQVRAHPSTGHGAGGHLHFRLLPDIPAAQRAAYQAFDTPSAFASLADAISH
jgi:diadenosine tetraphosphate (Ap4A) HIT family hydrolase